MGVGRRVREAAGPEQHCRGAPAPRARVQMVLSTILLRSPGLPGKWGQGPVAGSVGAQKPEGRGRSVEGERNRKF